MGIASVLCTGKWFIISALCLWASRVMSAPVASRVDRGVEASVVSVAVGGKVLFDERHLETASLHPENSVPRQDFSPLLICKKVVFRLPRSIHKANRAAFSINTASRVSLSLCVLLFPLKRCSGY